MLPFGQSTIRDESTAGREALNLGDLQSTIRAFIKERDWQQFHSPKNLAMALSVEVAEIVEHFLWTLLLRRGGLGVGGRHHPPDATTFCASKLNLGEHCFYELR
jgi:hypothetical protein